MAMELTFKSDIAQLPTMLQFNYDELKEGLAKFLGKFDNLVVTEDGIKDAEADRAAINKTRDAIKAARIKIKRDAFDEFEKKAKELEAMCDKASEGIDSQLKAFEKARQEHKKSLVADLIVDKLNATFDNKCDSDESIRKSPYWHEFLDTNWTRRQKAWKNEGTSIESIEKEIDNEIERVVAAADTLGHFTDTESVETRAVAFEAFYKRLNTEVALVAMSEYKEQQKIIAERKAKEEQAKQAAEVAKSATPTVVSKMETTTQPVAEPPKPEASDEPILVYRLEIYGTTSNLKALRKFMDEKGITYKKF